MVKIAVYPVRVGKSANGNPYFTQLHEVQQSPVRPNATTQRFVKSEADALAPGIYTADCSFYEAAVMRERNGKTVQTRELLPSFTNYKLVKA